MQICKKKVTNLTNYWNKQDNEIIPEVIDHDTNATPLILSMNRGDDARQQFLEISREIE